VINIVPSDDRQFAHIGELLAGINEEINADGTCKDCSTRYAVPEIKGKILESTFAFSPVRALRGSVWKISCGTAYKP